MTDFLKLCPAVFAVFVCDPRFARVAFVISEALDSIPTFDRPPKLLGFFLRYLSALSRRRDQRSPQL
jgi:hypothetical protein